jgi:hypothetical protein
MIDSGPPIEVLRTAILLRTLRMLNAAGARILRTDQCGAVTVQSDRTAPMRVDAMPPYVKTSVDKYRINSGHAANANPRARASG